MISEVPYAISRTLKGTIHFRDDVKVCDVTTGRISPGLINQQSASCPFDESLWRSIQEDQFGVKLLLQLQLTCLSHLRQKTANQITA